MFTGFQLEIVAYKAPDSSLIYCTQCWRTPGDTEEDERLERDAAVTRHDAEDYADAFGLYCDECGAAIVPPLPDEQDFEESFEDDEYPDPDLDAESIYMEGQRDEELPGNSDSI